MVPFQNQVSSKCTGLSSFPSETEKAPSGKARLLHNGYSKKLAPRVWGLQPPAQVSPWLRSPQGGVNRQVFLATCVPIRAAWGHSEDVHHPMQ